MLIHVLQQQRATPIFAHGTIAHGPVALHTRDYKDLMLDLTSRVVARVALSMHGCWCATHVDIMT